MTMKSLSFSAEELEKLRQQLTVEEMEDLAGAIARLLKSQEKEIAESMGVPDWTYRDLPWAPADFYPKFIEVVGEENFKFLAKTERANGDWRGQILVSPEGMERILMRTKELSTKH
jgi:hypothetical protein